MLCIYLEINTNYVYPCRGPIYPWRGPLFPLSGTGTPPGGLVLFFQYMQLYLIINSPCRGLVPLLEDWCCYPNICSLQLYLHLILLEGLADGLLSINPSPQVTTFIIGQLDPKCMFNSIMYVQLYYYLNPEAQSQVVERQ